jgi:hypothetical protein
MAEQSSIRDDLTRAIEAALENDWKEAHELVQRHEGMPLADWLHACLHKIEGDAPNSRYWYAQTHVTYERYADPRAELREIMHAIDTET